ncbi:MAG: hypothetical protein II892_14240 [Fibrobacter sp.]|jgi:hypothetical protein|nr:hypothetical protein [Fibrobacter sp.]
MVKSTLILASLLCVGAAYAQLVQKNDPAEKKVNLSMQRPLVVTGDSLNKVKALDDSVSTVNKDPTLVDAVRTGAISKGTEIVGQTLKDMLSPTSIETKSVELERDYR